MRNTPSILLTGLPASGKTTTANLLASALKKKSLDIEILDGDEIRKYLSSDLGFSKEDRIKHAKRIAYVSKLLNKNGIAVIISIIAPFDEMRKILKNEIENFVEVYLECSLQACEERDFKKNYEKAKKGEIKNFTGISSEYEIPKSPDLICNTEKNPSEKCVELILKKLISLNYFSEEKIIYTSEEEEEIKNQLKNLGYF